MSNETKKKNKPLKPKGSIVYELLAVLLIVALYFTLTYPSKLWKQEEQNTQQCRQNMYHIYYAQVTYLNDSLVYADSLDKVINHILDDTTRKNLRLFTSLDSTIGRDIINYFDNSNYEMTITRDSVFGEGPDSVITKKVKITVPALIDSMSSYAKRWDIDTTEAFILDSLRSVPGFSKKIDSIASVTLNNMSSCPTVGKEYKIVALNDTTPKIVNIYCPIDSQDIKEVEEDFKRSFLGGLKIENHGALEAGKKTW